jgi:hypothetical protein
VYDFYVYNCYDYLALVYKGNRPFLLTHPPSNILMSMVGPFCTNSFSYKGFLFQNRGIKFVTL